MPSDEKRKEYLRIILLESERLTALVENVLDFARVERGKAAFDFLVGDLGESVSCAAELFRHRAEREGMALVVEIPDELPKVRLDPRAFELAFNNLLDNAAKYAREGGHVTLSVHREGESVEVASRISPSHGSWCAPRGAVLGVPPAKRLAPVEVRRDGQEK